MADGDFDTSDYQAFTDNEEKALDMAREFLKFCQDHNYPSDLILAGGVAWDAENIKQKAYDAGVMDERNRIKSILGL